MKLFFSDDIGIPFHMFDATHITMSAVTLLLIIAVFYYRDILKKWKYKDKPVRYTVAIIMFLNMVIWDSSKIWIEHNYDWKIDLPLHLCFITGFCFMYVLLSDNKKFYKIVYFFTFIGPLPAMIWPDLNQWFDRFLIYQFIISHHFMTIASMYCLCVLEYKVERKDIFRTLIAGNVLIAVITIFNNLFGTNYIMVYELPKHVVKIMPFIAKYFTPIFWLELCGMLAIAVAYLPVALLKWSEKRRGVINGKV